MTYTSFSHCGTDHAEWLKALDFYKTEIGILEKKLREIVKKNTGHEAMALAEHFQNQFIIQRENIDKLKHDIHEHEGKVVKDIQAHAGKIEVGLAGEHDAESNQFKQLEEVINDLRHEFNLFLSKWM